MDKKLPRSVYSNRRPTERWCCPPLLKVLKVNVLVSLPDVVKGGMRLLGVTWAEMVEQALKDRWGGKHDDFCAYLGDQGSTVHPCQSEVERGGQKVDQSILKSDGKDVTLKSIGCNGA
jgi:hypothetical protein